MALASQRMIMNGKRIDFALRRMAQEIIENNSGVENLALVGIADGGIPITNRIRQYLIGQSKNSIDMGMIDITLYRDDLTINDQPELKETKIDFDIAGMTIVLVDDVLFTGRTVRAAITALLEYGRPSRIQLAVLMDRGRRELPIQADFVGLKMDTKKEQQVDVRVLDQADLKKDKVLLITFSEKEED